MNRPATKVCIVSRSIRKLRLEMVFNYDFEHFCLSSLTVMNIIKPRDSCHCLQTLLLLQRGFCLPMWLLLVFRSINYI